MIKLRFETWYWGNYCVAPEGTPLPVGFELYDEEKHGWHNSEEYRVYGRAQYTVQEPPDTLAYVTGLTYIKNKQKEIAARN